MEKAGRILLTLVSLLIAGCSDSSDIAGPDQSGDPVVEGQKVVENYVTAYNTRDEALLATTLDTQFIHHLLQEDWDDYDGDGVIDTTWGYDFEMNGAQILFSNYEAIELNLEGLWYFPWPADPTGESIAFPRSYQMKLFYSYPDSCTIVTGRYTIVCKPDSTDTWHLTHLIDQKSILSI